MRDTIPHRTVLIIFCFTFQTLIVLNCCTYSQTAAILLIIFSDVSVTAVRRDVTVDQGGRQNPTGKPMRHEQSPLSRAYQLSHVYLLTYLLFIIIIVIFIIIIIIFVVIFIHCVSKNVLSHFFAITSSTVNQF